MYQHSGSSIICSWRPLLTLSNESSACCELRSYACISYSTLKLYTFLLLMVFWKAHCRGATYCAVKIVHWQPRNKPAPLHQYTYAHVTLDACQPPDAPFAPEWKGGYNKNIVAGHRLRAQGPWYQFLCDIKGRSFITTCWFCWKYESVLAHKLVLSVKAANLISKRLCEQWLIEQGPTVT